MSVATQTVRLKTSTEEECGEEGGVVLPVLLCWMRAAVRDARSAAGGDAQMPQLLLEQSASLHRSAH